MKFFGREIPPAPTAGKDNKIEQSAQTPNPEASNPEADLSINNTDKADAEIEADTPTNPDRRKFLGLLGKAATVGVGVATFGPEMLEARNRQPKEMMLPTAEQRQKFINDARDVAMRPDMQKFALETKNIPRSVGKMRKILRNIESSDPGKVAELRQLAKDNGIDFSILFAIGVVESNWNPNLTGGAGEAGLMQVKLMTARSVNYKGTIGNPNQLTGLYDPATNIEHALKYFGYVFTHAPKLEKGDIKDMLGHYNQGPHHDVPSTRYGRNTAKISLLEERAEQYSDKVSAVFYHYIDKYADDSISDYELYIAGANVEMQGSPLYAYEGKSSSERPFYAIDKNKLKDPQLPIAERQSIAQSFERINAMITQFGEPGQLGALRVKHDIDLVLIYALIATESQGDVYTQSNDGRIGPMQVDPAIAEQYGFTADSLYDDVTNIDVGMTHLRKILDSSAQGDLFDALRQYNNQGMEVFDYETNKEFSQQYKKKISDVLYYYFNRAKLSQ